MTDREAFEWMAKKFEHYDFTLHEVGDMTYWDFESEERTFDPDNITSDDYQFLAREMGYVIEPQFTNGIVTPLWFAIVRGSRVQERLYDCPSTSMLQAVQAGFHRIIEIEQKKQHFCQRTSPQYDGCQIDNRALQRIADALEILAGVKERPGPAKKENKP